MLERGYGVEYPCRLLYGESDRHPRADLAADTIAFSVCIRTALLSTDKVSFLQSLPSMNVGGIVS